VVRLVIEEKDVLDQLETYPKTVRELIGHFKTTDEGKGYEPRDLDRRVRYMLLRLSRLGLIERVGIGNQVMWSRVKEEK
jgi:hypothetical protein